MYIGNRKPIWCGNGGKIGVVCYLYNFGDGFAVAINFVLVLKKIVSSSIH